MAKGKKAKKKNWKLRRQLRKTLGCLFMISAIIVTAVPVQPLEAAKSDGVDTTVEHYVTAGALAADVKDDEQVYYTQDGLFRFSYTDSGLTNKFAVIAGYDERYLEGGALKIPNIVDAYMQYSPTDGTDQGFVAASQDGSPLFYRPVIKAKETVQVDGGMTFALDEDGKRIQNTDGSFQMVQETTEITRDVTRESDNYRPCYSTEYHIWHSLNNGQDEFGNPIIEDVELYYWDETETDPAKKYKPVNGGPANKQRIKNAIVKYISGSSLEIQSNTVTIAGKECQKYTWKNKGEANETTGVFAGQKGKNISKLEIGNELLGIGNYAFYDCTNLLSISLDNGVTTIGNYAFANCRRLRSATIVPDGKLTVIGDHAFSGCSDLESFEVPYAVTDIGDSAFEDCIKLHTVKLRPDDDSSVSLQRIGYKAFENCSSLQKLELPQGFNGGDRNEFHLTTVRGCTSLSKISTPSKTLQIVTDANGDKKIDGTYTFEKFKAEMPASFYVEAYGYSDPGGFVKTPVHATANKEHIAFSYLELQPNPGKYEIVEYALLDNGAPNTAIELVFAVNNANQLIDFEIIGEVEKVGNITIPEVIGPHNVSEINEESFADNCYVKKITLPASLHILNNNAFKGCHRLKHIIFNDATGITSIGSGAFDTQVVQSGHKCAKDLEDFPYLSFSGAVMDDTGANTEPFKYAMKSTSNINRGTQPTTYITYYSGWPTNLTIKYNAQTGMAELIDYPTRSEVESGYVYSADSGTVSGNTADIFSNGYKYPYITKERSNSAKAALGNYEAWIGGTGSQPTEDEVDIAESAVYNMVIPKGVTAVKTGLFSGVGTNNAPVAGTTKNDEVKSVTFMSVENVEPYTFSKLAKLETFNMTGGSGIGNYALNDCNVLANVAIGPSVTTMGVRPFKSCDVLKNVDFGSSENFACKDGIIFGKTNGKNTKIIQCLETRGNGVGTSAVLPEELADVKEIEVEAFMNCDHIGEVDLSSSSIKIIPERCFADYEADPDNPSLSARNGRLGKVLLPSGATQIKTGAFWNSKVYAVVVPSTVTYIEPNAFSNTNGMVNGTGGWDGSQAPLFDDTGHSSITLVCEDDSAAATYTDNYEYMDHKMDDSLKKRYTIYFLDAFDPMDSKLIGEPQYVMHGEDAIPPTPPEHEGYTFDYWYPPDQYKAVTVDNLEISAMYRKNDVLTWLVEFIDWDDNVLKSVQVPDGTAAEAPPEPTREGWIFTGWRGDFSKITEKTKIYAEYKQDDPAKYTVTFYDEDGKTVLRREQVEPGGSAAPPEAPAKEGYTFKGWIPADGYKNVQSDVTVYAQYAAGSGTDDPDDPNDPNNPDDPNNPNDPNEPNNGNNGNSNNNNNNNNNNSTSDNSVSGNSTKYKVVVNGGSGSGDYTPGTIVNINAYATADGKVFDKWTSSSFGVGFVNTEAISTTFTMPSNNVEINANFKTGSSSSSVSNNSRNRNRNDATTVDITKNGISNTDLASANVNGSSDNYVIKITEDAQATSEVIAALENKYGDLSNIAYLPMDISLYDSTGQTKITDVSGISVDITLPLPDELIQYAGNNRAASVVNHQLEDLNTKFTTIDGIPCVQFSATHFSPYTIYVDKGNLTEGLIDATPKTGDPIHPKWFLAVGLACISIILFCKKDKGQQKVKTA